MEQYNNSIIDYYSLKYQNLIKCENCDNNIIIEETNHSIMYSCGNKSGKCGIKIKIELPKYKNIYDVYNLKKIINESINYDVLKKYFKIDQKSKDDIINQINLIESKYNDQNKILKKKEIINKLLKDRENLYIKKNNTLDNYVENTLKINELYIQALDIVKQIKSIVIIDDPKIIKSDNEIINPENVKVDQPNVVVVDKKSSNKIDNKNKNIFAKWLYRNKFKYGKIIKQNKKKSIILSNDSEYIVDNVKIIIINEKQYNDNTINKKDLLKKNMIINWTDKKGNIINGKIIKLNKTKVIVEDDKKNEYIIDYDKIII